MKKNIEFAEKIRELKMQMIDVDENLDKDQVDHSSNDKAFSVEKLID